MPRSECLFEAEERASGWWLFVFILGFLFCGVRQKIVALEHVLESVSSGPFAFC